LIFRVELLIYQRVWLIDDIGFLGPAPILGKSALLSTRRVRIETFVKLDMATMVSLKLEFHHGIFLLELLEH
jgi:hypothetical protein